MKATNGAAHSLNGHGLNGHSQNGHRSYTLDPIEAKRDAIKGKLGLIACIIIALLIGGWACYGIHIQPTPDPYNAIEAQIDNIDLDQPKHDIRLELDEIKSAVEDLRPGYEPDPPTVPGGV
jgi:hypothetical protein